MSKRAKPGELRLGGCSGRMVLYADGGEAADVDTLDNARMFCASPDLLAACNQLLAYCERHIPDANWPTLPDDVHEARAAIQKAKGNP